MTKWYTVTYTCKLNLSQEQVDKLLGEHVEDKEVINDKLWDIMEHEGAEVFLDHGSLVDETVDVR